MPEKKINTPANNKKANDPKLANKGDAGFVDTDLGSATVVNLDGASESEGYVTEKGIVDADGDVDGLSTRGAPWGRVESLKYMCSEVGIDFDEFINALGNGESDEEMSVEFDVSQNTIRQFREHFEKYGIDSVQGQD